MKPMKVLLLSFVALVAIPVSTALAQYPPPDGSCTGAPTTIDVAPNSVIDLIVTSLDKAGKPLPNVGGSAVLVSQPGEGASLLTPTFITGANGTAIIRLQTGNAAGAISLALKCGNVDGVAGVKVGGSLPKPPDTGTGSGTASDGGSSSTLLLGGSAVVLAGIAGLVLRRKTRRHNHPTRSA